MGSRFFPVLTQAAKQVAQKLIPGMRFNQAVSKPKPLVHGIFYSTARSINTPAGRSILPERKLELCHRLNDSRGILNVSQLNRQNCIFLFMPEIKNHKAQNQLVDFNKSLADRVMHIDIEHKDFAVYVVADLDAARLNQILSENKFNFYGISDPNFELVKDLGYSYQSQATTIAVLPAYGREEKVFHVSYRENLADAILAQIKDAPSCRRSF